MPKSVPPKEPPLLPSPESSGGPVGYYLVEIKFPARDGHAPYTAHCQDIIEALRMDFNAGEAFKAIWRMYAARTLGLAKADDSPIRNAEKVQYFGGRMVAVEKLK